MRSILKLITAITITYISITHAYAANQDLLVSDSNGLFYGLQGNILRYDGETGEFLGAFNSDTDVPKIPQGMTLGPDGNLYVADSARGGPVEPGSLDIYDGATGELIGSSSAPGNFQPTDVAFGPDGNVYASIVNLGAVQRYNVTRGRWDVFPFTSGGDLLAPASLTFGPDGNLYVSDYGSGDHPGSVQRFDGTTGQFIDRFVSDNITGAAGIAFGPDGNLYVGRGGEILKFDGQSGQVIRTSYPPGLQFAHQLTFGPDGYLYVSDYGSYPDHPGSVLRIDPAQLTFIDVFASGDEMQGPRGVTFTPPSYHCQVDRKGRCQL